MSDPQPAKPSYILYQGFIELNNLIVSTFANCKESIIDNVDDLQYSFHLFKETEGILRHIFFFIICLFPFGYSLSRLIFITFLTPIICALITICQIVILLTLFPMAYFFVIIVMLADWLFCLINAIGNHCPNCQERFILPTYFCECGREHSHLVPGRYGIFKRKCLCGRKLSTSFLAGRHHHDAHCPACKYDITNGLMSSVCIPVVGGAYTGKTCYINMTMLSLEQNAQKYELTFEYVKNDRDVFAENVANLSQGKYPQKTQNLDYLTYYQFTLSPKGAIKQMISLCDVAGEIYDIKIGNDSIRKQKGLRFANAFILIIDPLSITDFRTQALQNLPLAQYRGSTLPIGDVVESLINTLQNMFNLSAKDIIDTDVAVVFTKMDIPGLNDLIGNAAVAKKSPSQNQIIRYGVQNQLCEAFLRKYGEVNFLQNFKARFRNIQFFTCSALGHPENGQPFTPQYVEEPLFWLLKRNNSVFAKVFR